MNLSKVFEKKIVITLLFFRFQFIIIVYRKYFEKMKFSMDSVVSDITHYDSHNPFYWLVNYRCMKVSYLLIVTLILHRELMYWVDDELFQWI